MAIDKNLTIIIVSFNSGYAITQCLRLLLESPPCKILIVDNASTDNTVSLIESDFPNVEIILSEKNIGYGRAANLGLERVLTKYSLLLNPDVFLDIKTLSLVFNEVFACSQDVAIFSPSLKNQDYLKEGNISVQYLIGAFLLFNMECLKKIGFFDENIFLFYEEKDLELRAIKQGYQLVLMSDHYVEHIKSASTKKSESIDFLRNWHVAWSSFYYSYKHGLMKNKYEGIFLMIRYGIKSLINLRQWKRKKYRARFLGCAAYLRGEKAFANDVARHSEKLINNNSNFPG